MASDGEKVDSEMDGTSLGGPSTVVYRYGLAAPHEGADTVREQMRRARDYRRALVAVECERRTAARAALTDLAPDVAIAEAVVVGTNAACAWLGAEIALARKVARKRAETAPMRERVARARAILRDHRGALFAARERYASQCRACRAAKSEAVPCPHATPEARRLRSRLDEVDEQATARAKVTRDGLKMYWATYLLVDRAMQASRGAPLYEKDGVTPHDPKYKPSPSEAVAVQVQSTRPLTVRGAESGTDSRLRITPPPWPEEWLAANRVDPATPSPPHARLPGQRPDGSPAPASRADGTPARWAHDHACRHGELRMRVGPEDDPQWAAWRLDRHQSPPPGAQVRWATVVRRARGPHAEWSLHLTVGTGLGSAPAPTGKQVAVDVGWRVIGDELRVAAWRDSDGQSGELRLTAKDLCALSAADSVQSIRDTRLDALRARLRAWIKAEGSDLPDWLREATATLHAWRAPKKFVRLLRQWETEGAPSPTDGARAAYDDLAAWAENDRHRWAEQEHRRAWGLRRRRDKYRVFAAKLATAYDVVVLEKFDLRKVAEHRAVGQDEVENEVARGNRQRASVHELRDAVENAARSRGRSAVAVDAVDSTRTCPACGLVEDRGQEARVVLRCECGHEWDQDRDGAALVLLSRYRERPGDAKVLVAARDGSNQSEQQSKKGDKWARAKRMSAQKKSRMETAREAG